MISVCLRSLDWPIRNMPAVWLKQGLSYGAGAQAGREIWAQVALVRKRVHAGLVERIVLCGYKP